MAFNDVEVHSIVEKSWASSKVSDIYEQTRPNYNKDSVECLLEKLGVLESYCDSQEFQLVEVGAGTGKFTRAALRVLEERAVDNVKLISTEPMKEMCEKFREMVPPHVEIHECSAHNLGLPSGCANAVVAAQCFHWFANKESVSEIHRVLKPGGMFGVIWNIPDRGVPYIRAIEEMLDIRFQEVGIIRPPNENLFHCITNHGGFSTVGSNSSYHFHQETDLDGINRRYTAYSVVAGAEENERPAILSKIQDMVKTNLGEKSEGKFSYHFKVYIFWFKKILQN